MLLNYKNILMAAGIALASSSALASDEPVHEQVQVPQCLASAIKFEHSVLAENDKFQIIDLKPSQLNNLALLADKVHCGRFLNVSHQMKGALLPEKQQIAQFMLDIKKPAKLLSNQYSIKHESEVNEALLKVVPDNIWATLTKLTSFRNRSATKTTGVEAAKWLQSQFEAMATQYGRTDTNTFFVETGWYQQPSLVTVIGKDIKAPGIVLGAHMDTLDGLMPGAGDDGSGSSSIMEMARVLLSSKYEFKRPIYIVWYAAEERGLVGSQYVVEYMQEHNLPVKAAIQFDMTGYRSNPEDRTMWVFTDYTNNALNQFVASLINTYIKVPVDYSKCGYSCSDHASWTEANIPAAFPCESSFHDVNPYIHSSGDTMELMNLDHMTNFSKLALAFALELGLE